MDAIAKLESNAESFKNPPGIIKIIPGGFLIKKVISLVLFPNLLKAYRFEMVAKDLNYLEHL